MVNACPECNHKNPGDKSYCMNCGARLSVKRSPPIKPGVPIKVPQGHTVSDQYDLPGMRKKDYAKLSKGQDGKAEDEVIRFYGTPNRTDNKPISQEVINAIPGLSIGIAFDEKVTSDVEREKHPVLNDILMLIHNGKYQIVSLDFYLSRNPSADMGGNLLKVTETYPDYCNFLVDEKQMATTVGTVTFSNFPSDIINRADVTLKGKTAGTRRDYRQYPIFHGCVIQNLSFFPLWLIFDRGISYAGDGVGFYLGPFEKQEFKIKFTDIYYYSWMQAAKMNGICYF